MRTLILVLTFSFTALTAHAATIMDFDGKWGVDFVTTAEKTPQLKPDEEMLDMVLTIDAKAGTMRMGLPGRPGPLRTFTVQGEGPTGVVIRREDGRILKLQSYSVGRLAVGELKNRQLAGVMYFVRPQGRSKTPPLRVRPSFAPPKEKL